MIDYINRKTGRVATSANFTPTTNRSAAPLDATCGNATAKAITIRVGRTGASLILPMGFLRSDIGVGHRVDRTGPRYENELLPGHSSQSIYPRQQGA